jgi:hypothetical protein
MKKLILSLSVFTLSTTLFAQKPDDVAKFKSEVIDFGKVEVDAPPTATFLVTNVGKEPLIIEQANPTCGCTIGDYTKSPIAPGKDGWIKATYNAKNIGAFEKHMTVKFAGVNETKSITIKGEVLSKEDFAKLAPVKTTEVKTKANGEVKTKTTTTIDGKKTTKSKVKTKHPVKETAAVLQ